jgi:hypothetical protein
MLLILVIVDRFNIESVFSFKAKSNNTAQNVFYVVQQIRRLRRFARRVQRGVSGPGV